MLLPQTDLNAAGLIAEAAREAVLNQGIPHAASSLGVVSISLGIAGWTPGPQDSAGQLVEAADAALYQAKHEGKNRVNVHQS